MRLSISTNNSKESDSIQNQRKFLNNYLDNNKELCEFSRTEYIDDGFTGTNENRSEFQKLISDARIGNINIICVKDSSRFFRDYTEAGNYIECVFPFLNIRYISVNDNYDSNNFKGTTGGFELAIQNIVNDYYSKDISKKIRSSQKLLIEQGKYIGSVPPYGYIKDPNNKHQLIIDPIASEVVRKIFEYAIKCKRLSEIANILNRDNVIPPMKYFALMYKTPNYINRQVSEWSYCAIHRIITNTFYIGNIIIYKNSVSWINSKKIKTEPIIITNAQEPIVTNEEFQTA